MRKMIGLFALMSVLVSCGNKAKPIKYGEMKVADLMVLKGEPLEKEEIKQPQGEMYIYENNEKFQIEKGIVVNSFRQPQQDEKMLLYWKHKYSDCIFEVKKLSQKEVHTRPEEEYRCVSAGISIIYNPNIEQVVRVVEYAAE